MIAQEMIQKETELQQTIQQKLDSTEKGSKDWIHAMKELSFIQYQRFLSKKIHSELNLGTKEFLQEQLHNRYIFI